MRMLSTIRYSVDLSVPSERLNMSGFIIVAASNREILAVLDPEFCRIAAPPRARSLIHAANYSPTIQRNAGTTLG